MDKKDFLMRLDSSAIDVDFAQTSKELNPEVWEKKMVEYASDRLVMAKLGESYDFRGMGQQLTVTVASAPAASAVVAETASTTIVQPTYTQVSFVPTEYSAAYQVTDKEKDRAFFSWIAEVSKRLGYSYGLAIEDKCFGVVIAGVGETILANSAASLAAIDEDDTLGIGDITKALEAIELESFEGYAIVVSPYGLHQIRDVIEARDTLAGDGMLTTGFKGSIMGMPVYLAHRVPSVGGTAVTTVAQALVLGQSMTGQKPFGIAYKRDPVIKSDYNGLGRYTDYVATGEFDVKVLQADGLVKIQHFGAE